MKLNELDLMEQMKIFDVPVSSQRDRLFFSGGQEWIDFCSTNYLGWDFDQRMHEKGSDYAKKWGALTGWSRLEADPLIYRSLEERICKLTGARKALLGHTITISALSNIPFIVGTGTVFADAKVHTVIYEACRLARDHGAELARFKHNDLNDLEAQLRKCTRSGPKLVVVDGVHSISTVHAPIQGLLELCEKYDAFLMVDDAHGFGIFGEIPTAENPYGVGGGGICRLSGQGGHDRLFYITSFGKAFCTHTAFCTIPERFKENLRTVATQYIFSAPPAPYLIGLVDAALDLNETEGENRRKRLRELTQRFLDGAKTLGIEIENVKLHPVVYMPVGRMEDLVEVARSMWKDARILSGIRAFPLVPQDRCGLRFGITALNTEQQVDRLLEVIGSPKLRSRIQSKKSRAA